MLGIIVVPVISAAWISFLSSIYIKIYVLVLLLLWFSSPSWSASVQPGILEKELVFSS